ncbi:DNA repair protein RadA/Sms [Methylomarinovum caldicuralii]|uniref:DNA repair protein RadA n=1 Tax=Methylomarinovum caldicuralii TaxID=438856 RepID=A0AAU9C6P2_9GAMM|nr:DNA repair protein RadA [Methylomarinovum caldicuralii]BCX82860.1 DNA repair protein RadA/Sms [Methylomarinovum caldicuralii]
MARAKVVYSCSECGHTQPKWAGRCPACGAWSTLVETVAEAKPAAGRFAGYAGAAGEGRIVPLGEVEAAEVARIATGLGELDRVLGGGLVKGSAVLIGGDPGIGKSTLLLQAAATLSRSVRILYTTGEESVQQVGLRAERLAADCRRVPVLAETALERIAAIAERERPEVLVIDSIQTVYSEQLSSAPGSVAQVRECAAQLVRQAKARQMALFLVGHVTKEGALAGPRVLEHMVDTVLYFEGEAGSRFRVLRAVKNRFGATGELGVFAMTEGGLKEVRNPSAIFLSRQIDDAPGSAVCVIREGSRPLLIEVQALVDDSPLGNPRRITVGMEHNRLAMLLAVLHRHGGVPLAGQDVFVNVVGGVRLAETAGDLAVVAAVLSSLKDRPLPRDWVIFGEIGLTGEVRPVPHGEERLREAAKHGFKRAIVPKANVPKKGIEGMEIAAVRTLQEALEAL